MSGSEPSGPASGAAAGGGRRGRPVPRVATLVVVAATLVAAVVSGRVSHRARPSAAAAVLMPVAAPAAAVSSSWFCAGPVAAPAKVAEGRLVVANTGSRPVHARVTLLPSNGPASTQEIDVDAGAKAAVSERPDAGSAPPYLGALVELDGGRAAVQQVISGSGGTSSAACATSGSSSWYFPTGTTQESSTLSLTLVNPFPGDAIADLSFVTEQGQENPQDFQGIVVPANSTVGIDIGGHLRLRASVATSVSLRVGRVAAFETQTVQALSAAAAANQPPGSAPWPPGTTLMAGAPATSTSWAWPAGQASDAGKEQYVVYNPSGSTALVSLQPDLDQGSADAFQLSVDAHAVALVATNAESRIPKNVGHAAALRSTNHVGVVASRLALAVSPAAPLGVASLLGAPMAVRHWLVPGDKGTDAVNAVVVVYNPGTSPVTVSLSSPDGPLAGPSSAVVPGHQRLVTATPAASANPAPAGMVLVDATGPVVVERDVWPAKGLGMDDSIGVPLTP